MNALISPMESNIYQSKTILNIIMVDEGTFLIDHRNYFTFPQSFSQELNPDSVKRIIFKSSGHCKIELEGNQWRNLETILIQGCRFIDMRIQIPEGHLREIIVVSSKYVSFLDVRGTFPKLDQWAFDHCKYLSLKGPFIAKMTLKQIIINHCPQFKLFENPGLLPFLEEIEVKHSHHAKVDFGVIELPKLRKVNFEECSMIKIKNFGKIFSSLSEFLITHCNKIWMNESMVIQLKNFAGFKYTPLKTEQELYGQLIGLSENNQDMVEIEGELADLEQYRGDPLSNEENGEDIDTPESEDSQIPMKFCPECGQKAFLMAKFCPNCGTSFRQ